MVLVPRISAQRTGNIIQAPRERLDYTADEFGGIAADALQTVAQTITKISAIEKSAEAKAKALADNEKLNLFTLANSDTSQETGRAFEMQTDGSDPRAASESLDAFNDLLDARLEEFKTGVDPEAYSRALVATERSKVMMRHNILGYDSQKRATYAQQVNVKQVKNYQVSMVSSRNDSSEVPLLDAMKQIEASTRRTYPFMKPEDVDARVEEQWGVGLALRAKAFIDDGNFAAAKKLSEGAAFKNWVPKQVRENMAQTVKDGATYAMAGSFASGHVGKMVKEDDFTVENTQKMQARGQERFGKNPQALRAYNRQFNAQLRDVVQLKNERISVNGADGAQRIVDAANRDAALRIASEAMIENQRKLADLAENMYPLHEFVRSEVPPEQLDMVMGTARLQIEAGTVKPQNVASEYGFLPKKSIQELQKFAKDFSNKAPEAMLNRQIGELLKLKGETQTSRRGTIIVDPAVQSSMLRAVQESFGPHTPTPKELDERVDMLLLDGTVLNQVDEWNARTGMRGGAMSAAEAMATGQFRYWVPTLSDRNYLQVYTAVDKDGNYYDFRPEGEAAEFDAESILVRDQFLADDVPVYGENWQQSRNRRLKFQTARTNEIRSNLVAQDQARMNLTQAMGSYESSSINPVTQKMTTTIGKMGMTQDLYAAARSNTLPQWMTTTLITSGHIGARTDWINTPDPAQSTSDKIIDLGLQLLDAADDVR